MSLGSARSGEVRETTLSDLINMAWDHMREIVKYNPDATPSELLEIEENSRQFTPDEFWIAELNQREDSDEAWSVVEDAFQEVAEKEGRRITIEE